jgi:hypothetical protein
MKFTCTAVLAAMCTVASAQGNRGYTEPYFEQYGPVYIEDKILRVIKDVRGIADSVYAPDQPDYGGTDRSYYTYQESERGFYDRRGNYDDDDDDD